MDTCDFGNRRAIAGLGIINGDHFWEASPSIGSHFEGTPSRPLANMGSVAHLGYTSLSQTEGEKGAGQVFSQKNVCFFYFDRF